MIKKYNVEVDCANCAAKMEDACRKISGINSISIYFMAQPVKETVPFEDFQKLDIRVGIVKACEKVKKSKKLLRFSLDDGSGTDRTILSGIAQWYEPEQMVGKRVLFIANLAPRKIMGEESHGMILSAVNYDGNLSVTTTLDEVKGGSTVE